MFECKTKLQRMIIKSNIDYVLIIDQKQANIHPLEKQRLHSCCDPKISNAKQWFFNSTKCRDQSDCYRAR